MIIMQSDLPAPEVWSFLGPVSGVLVGPNCRSHLPSVSCRSPYSGQEESSKVHVVTDFPTEL